MPRLGRRGVTQGYTTFGRTKRIKVDNNPARPFKLNASSVIRRELLRKNPLWWITHRRGLRRPWIGADPLERRAYPKNVLKGTLPERIVYKWLNDHYFTPDVDFDFQSSMQGGRLQLGGMVVDFILMATKIALQVQGPTHGQFLRFRKDEEQRLTLEAMGYHVRFLDMEIIYDEPRFEEYMRRMLGLGYPAWGGEVQGYYEVNDENEGWMAELNQLQVRVDALAVTYADLNNRLYDGRVSL